MSERVTGSVEGRRPHRLTRSGVEGYAEVLRQEGRNDVFVVNVRSRLRSLATLHEGAARSRATRKTTDWRLLEPNSDEQMEAIAAAGRRLGPEAAHLLQLTVLLIEGQGMNPSATAEAKVLGSRRAMMEPITEQPRTS